MLEQIHRAEWNKTIQLDHCFQLTKRQVSLLDFETSDRFDIVYFDAFDPKTQPELWTESIFVKIYKKLNNNEIIVTYCSKGSVRRILEKVGFLVEKLAGPKGKREVIRALKIR
ncbi:MAG: MnmC family methyltransferase [Chitinophagaceae bacterium]